MTTARPTNAAKSVTNGLMYFENRHVEASVLDVQPFDAPHTAVLIGGGLTCSWLTGQQPSDVVTSPAGQLAADAMIGKVIANPRATKSEAHPYTRNRR